jgi:hypothetical protein
MHSFSPEVAKNFYLGKDHIFVQYNIYFEGQVINPGDRIRFRGNWHDFIFLCLAYDSEWDAEWIDAMNVQTGEIRAFHPNYLKRTVKRKRSYCGT